MDNRLYTVIDKALFYDPDNILIGAMEFCEIEDEFGGRAFDKIRGFFPHACTHSSFDGISGIKTVSVYRRSGRFDRDTEEIQSVLSLLRKTDATVKSGRQFYFSEGAGQTQINEFIKANVNTYVFISDIAIKPREAIFAEDNPIIEDFCQASYADVVKMRKRFDLKMEIDDLMCVQNYFISESREPSLIEIKIIDNFFSEHFRHTTFETILDSMETDDPSIRVVWEKYKEQSLTPSLSDITRAAQRRIVRENVVKASEKLSGVKIETAEGSDELILVVKNESHNRSTTAVPYDGAAGGIGGAIKDLLCVFGYPYDAYRAVGQGNDEKNTKNSVLSAAGYAETAALAGVSCSKCSETVSSGFDVKNHEACAVLAVTSADSTGKALKKEPQEGDKIYLIGSKTGSDGSSCVYSNLKGKDSVGEYVAVSDGGELQALTRLFTRSEFADIAVAINDVSSGGIICALGEITEGADVNVSAIISRYGDVSVYDAVLSESNERMVVCIRSESSAKLNELCKADGVECVCIGSVNDEKRFVIYDDEGNRHASLTRAFLISGGAEKHLSATVMADGELPASEALAAAKAPLDAINPIKKLFGYTKYDFEKACEISAHDLESRRCEKNSSFDRSVTGDTTLLQHSTEELAVSMQKLSYKGKDVCGKNGKPVYSATSCGLSAEMSKIAPFRAAYLALTEATLKLIAAGFGKNEIYITLQEYFPEHKNNSARLGVSVASMLGCFEAQMQLGIPSIGGRASIGNVFGEQDIVSTVNAFAFCLCEKDDLVTSALAKAQSKIILINSEADKNGLPIGQSVMEISDVIEKLKADGKILSASALNGRNAVSVLMDMSAANGKGVVFDPDCEIENLFGTVYAAVVCEIEADADVPKGCTLLGYTSDEHRLVRGEDSFELSAFTGYEVKKQGVDKSKRYLYLKDEANGYGSCKTVNGERVSVLIPANRYLVPQNDIKAAFENQGATVKVFPLTENSISDFVKQIRKADVLWIPNGMGSIGFLNAALADRRVKSEIQALCERNGLVYGQGNAFEALLMSGLLELDAEKVSFSNTDKINSAVKVRKASTLSPFIRFAEIGKEYTSYVSGKRQKLTVDKDYADILAKDGRIALQYTADTNVTGSSLDIDAITSPDGRVFCQIGRAFDSDDALPIVKSVMGYFSVYN